MDAGTLIGLGGGLLGVVITIVAVLVTLLFPPVESMRVTPYEEGMVAPEDVIAQIPFSVPKSGGELERERREAAEAVPPTFDERVAAGDSVAARLGRFFDRLDSAVVSGDTLGVGRILQVSRVTAQASQIEYLLDDGRRNALRTAAQTAAREIIPRGMLDPAELSAIPTDIIYVRSPDVPERSRAVADLITSRDFYAEAVLYLPPGVPPDAQDLLRMILIFHLEYSLVPNIVATEVDRNAARSSVPLTKADVLQGEAIVRAADPIGPETLERLDAYSSALREAGLLESEEPLGRALLGSGLLTFMLLSMVYISGAIEHAEH